MRTNLLAVSQHCIFQEALQAVTFVHLPGSSGPSTHAAAVLDVKAVPLGCEHSWSSLTELPASCDTACCSHAASAESSQRMPLLAMASLMSGCPGCVAVHQVARVLQSHAQPQRVAVRERQPLKLWVCAQGLPIKAVTLHPTQPVNLYSRQGLPCPPAAIPAILL